MDRDYNNDRNDRAPRDSYRGERPNRERGSFASRPERPQFRNENRDRDERPRHSDGEERRERRDFRSSGNHYGDDRKDRSFGRSNGFENQRERSFNREDRGYRNYSAENRREEGNRRQEYRGGQSGSRPEGERRFSRSNYAGGNERNDERRERNYNSPRGGNDSERPRRFNREDRNDSRENGGERKVYKERNFSQGNNYVRERKELNDTEKEELRQKHYSKKKVLAHRLKNENADTELRLNRYISMGGVCSRRDADELIKTGRVKVNGEVVQTVGTKVRKKDKVEVDGMEITPERKVYLVLNKPKDYVTTVDDPMERKTVMSLVEGACKERVYPIGRLDRQTTGVLLFTNDGDLAKKLTHPKFDNKKIYHVFLDRPVSEQDLQTIANGIELEDGFIQVDEIRYASDDRMEVGVEIHSGKNRIVRRIFEHFGYQIVKLDRVYFAGITKKNLPRGKWRFLTSEEVNVLKFY